jgi:alkylation response protein AidB-like acyl-CoA dehydrogenase
VHSALTWNPDLPTRLRFDARSAASRFVHQRRYPETHSRRAAAPWRGVQHQPVRDLRSGRYLGPGTADHRRRRCADWSRRCYLRGRDVAHVGDGNLFLRHGSPEQCAFWTPRILGGALVAIAATERQGGSNVRHVRTVLNKQTDRLVINGDKTFISRIEEADAFVVFCRHHETGNLAAICEPADASGIKRRSDHPEGLGGWSRGTLGFNDVAVEPDVERGDPRAETWSRSAKAHRVETAHNAAQDVARLLGARGFRAQCVTAKAMRDIRAYLYADGMHDALLRSAGRELLGVRD